MQVNAASLQIFHLHEHRWLSVCETLKLKSSPSLNLNKRVTMPFARDEKVHVILIFTSFQEARGKAIKFFCTWISNIRL